MLRTFASLLLIVVMTILPVSVYASELDSIVQPTASSKTYTVTIPARDTVWIPDHYYIQPETTTQVTINEILSGSSSGTMSVRYKVAGEPGQGYNAGEFKANITSPKSFNIYADADYYEIGISNNTTNTVKLTLTIYYTN